MDISDGGVFVVATPAACPFDIACGDIVSHIDGIDVRHIRADDIVRVIERSIGSTNRSLTFTRGL